MDAAFAAFKKTSLFLALALLAAMPRLAQATPPTFTNPSNGAAYALLNGVGSIGVTGSADSAPTPTPIDFTVLVTYASGDKGHPWLAIGGDTTNTPNGACNGGTNVYDTPATLSLGLGCVAGGLSLGSHTATVELLPQSPSGVTPISFTVTYNAGGGNTAVLQAAPSSFTGSGALSAVAGAQTSATLQLTTNNVADVPFSTLSSASWLTVSPISGAASASSPGTLTLTASAAGLSSANSPYNATVTVSYGSSQTVSINVTFNVSASAVSLNPNSLSWTYANGTLSPSGAQNLALTTPNSDLYAAVVSYPSGAAATNWLRVNGVTSLSDLSNGSIFPVALVNYSNLAAGTYTGTITVTDTSNSTDIVTLTVTLTVPGSTGGSLTVSPSPIGLSSADGYQQLVTVTSTSSGTLTVTGSSTNNWLSVGTPPTTITTGTPVYFTVSANTSLSGQGIYSGTLTVTVGSVTQQVTVNLTSGNNTTVNSSGYVAPTTLNLIGVSGGSKVPQHLVFAGNGSFELSQPTFGSNVGAWLTISQIEGAMSTTGTEVTLTANPTYLTPGTYTATVPVSVTANNLTQPTLSLPVTFIVTSGEALEANPGIVLFSNGGTAPNQLVQINASGSTALPVSVTADQSWITAAVQNSATTTPAAILVTANTSAMSNGLYTGNVLVASGGSPTLYVPVVVVVTGVSNPSGLTLSSPSLTFSAILGSGSPSSQTLEVSSSTPGVSFTASASVTTPAGGAWLTITPSSGNLTTDRAISVSASTAGLAIGSYTGNISLNANGTSLNVPVNLVISRTGGGGSGSGNVTVSASTLNFSAVSGAGAPASQTLTVSSAAGSAAVPFTTSTESTGNWLAVSPTSGTTQAALTVSVNQTNLTAGDHSGSITITPSGGTPVVVQVTLDVINEPTVSVNPPALVFSYQFGTNSVVSPGQLTVTASGGTVNFTASASSSGNWLSVTPASGTTSTSTTLAVQVNTAGLVASGTPYSGTITIAGVNGSAGDITVGVSLVVTSTLPVIAAVTNAASFAVGPVSPGELVTIWGSSIGPSNSSSLTLDSSGKVSTSIGGVTVSFSGYPAPLTYVSSTQINAVVPYALAGNKEPFVEVIFAGQTSNEPSLQLATSAPGIFTQSGTGTGTGSILNQDYSVNTESNPASVGSVVQIYMTGEGLTTPAQATGTITQLNSGGGPLTPVPQLPVSVLIGGLPAQVEWDGEAPGLVAGILQVNAIVPATANPGANSITVQIGKQISQNGVTVWVK